MEKIFFRNWPKPQKSISPADLTLDLSAGAVGTFAIDYSEGALKEQLGAPASWADWKENRRWLYPQHGLWFGANQDGYIEGIRLFLREEAAYWIFSKWMKTFQPWKGSICFPGERSLDSPSVMHYDFIRLVGPPDERHEYEDGIHFSYSDPSRFNTFGFDVDFTKDGVASEIDLYSFEV